MQRSCSWSCSCTGIPYEQSVELEFGFGLLPGNQRFASVFGDCCFEIAEVFEIFDTLLKSSHGLIECLDLFENGGVTHKLPFDLLQHKLESWASCLYFGASEAT